MWQREVARRQPGLGLRLGDLEPDDSIPKRHDPAAAEHVEERPALFIGRRNRGWQMCAMQFLVASALRPAVLRWKDVQ